MSRRAPVRVTAAPGTYAFLAEDDAPEVVVVPRGDEDARSALVRDRGGAEVAGRTWRVRTQTGAM